jgi:hypothetical protein
VALAAGGALVAALGARPTLSLAGAIPVLAALAGVMVYRRRAAAAPAPQAGERPELPAVAVTAGRSTARGRPAGTAAP